MTSHKSTAIQLPLPIEGATVEIPLTRGYSTSVDPLDGDFAFAGCFTSANGNGNFYCSYRKAGRMTLLHRSIMARMLDRELLAGEFVDHKDGNGLNNRRSNLRIADRKGNSGNSKRNVKNTSGHKGVYWRKQSNKWCAFIHIDGKMKHLGLFTEFDEACNAYRQAATGHFGEFARFE